MTQHAFKPQIFPFTQKKNDKEYSAWRVRYEDKDGKRRLKQFPTKQEAKDFYDLEVINSKNREVQFSNVTTTLTQEQINEATSAFRRLGETYTLTEAVEYFLKYHRPAEVEMLLKEAIFRYTELKEQDGSVRERTLKQIKSTLNLFEAYHPEGTNLSDIGTPAVEAFLKSLKAKDGKSPATRKTWNNYLSDLNRFFEFCCGAGNTDKHEKDGIKTRWLMLNPCEGISRFKIIKDDTPEILSVKQVEAIMKRAAAFKEGALAPYFALALFAGIRTGDEISKLANHPNLSNLINNQTRKIHITPDIAKTHHPRKITITPVLAKWLKAYPLPILPTNADRDIKKLRGEFGIDNAKGRDIMRHTFISHHVAKFNSIGRTALESGNTEHIIKTHYLDLVSKRQGLAFFKIEPPKAEGKVIKFIEASA